MPRISREVIAGDLRIAIATRDAVFPRGDDDDTGAQITAEHFEDPARTVIGPPDLGDLSVEYNLQPVVQCVFLKIERIVVFGDVTRQVARQRVVGQA